MCLNLVTTHTQCLHANIAQIPCSHPSSGLSVLHFNLADECKKDQEDELIDRWCPACTVTWDSIRATQDERKERAEAFRRRNGYYGQLAPLRRAQDGSVVFASDLRYPIQVTERRREDDASFTFSNGRQIDTFARPSSSQTSSGSSSFQTSSSSPFNHSASSSRSSLEFSKSIKSFPSSLGMWPMSFHSGKEDERLPKENHSFGNPFALVDDANALKNHRAGETGWELGTMYRNQKLWRSLKEESIPPVAPMVSSTIARVVLVMPKGER